MMAELWVRCSGRWCSGGSERAWRSSAVMERRSASLGERERGGARVREREMKGAAMLPPSSLPFGLTSGPGASVRPPGGGRGLRAVSHQVADRATAGVEIG